MYRMSESTPQPVAEETPAPAPAPEPELTQFQKDENSLTGPDYQYFKQIKTPSELGMTSKGASLTTDFVGLVEYVKLLVSGDSKASVTGKPLGNKFFLKTMGQCTAVDTKELVPRYLYFNNVPEGNIPFISGALGVNFKEFRGIVPGAISDLNAFNPASIYRSLTSGVNPDCQNITLEVIDNNNNKGTETHYVALEDIQGMDPCGMPNGTNPVTGQRCRETFQNWVESSDFFVFLRRDPLAFLFLVGYCFVVFYLFSKSYVKYTKIKLFK
jgi:hypothetical protein